MENLSNADSSQALSDSIYEELQSEIQEGLKKVEGKDLFAEGTTRLKTIEIAIEILKNGERQTATKELYQHSWSWGKWGLSCLFGLIGPPIYQFYHYSSSTYSKEKAENLIKRGIKELVVAKDLAKEEVVRCAIKVNTADKKLFARGYWLNFEDQLEILCNHTFRKVS